MNDLPPAVLRAAFRRDMHGAMEVERRHRDSTGALSPAIEDEVADMAANACEAYLRAVGRLPEPLAPEAVALLQVMREHHVDGVMYDCGGIDGDAHAVLEYTLDSWARAGYPGTKDRP